MQRKRESEKPRRGGAGLQLGTTLLAVGMLVMLGACGEQTAPVSLDDTSKPSTARSVIQEVDRKATPWQTMSTEELTQEIQRVGGRVLIGFKDAGARDGVDNRGMVLASAGAVAEGLALVRSLGGEIQYEFKRIPAVAATIDIAAVATLRAHPNIDYLEPSAAGSYDAQVVPWNIDTVRATTAHSSSTGSGVKVIIIDSGVDGTHPDLSVPVAWRCVYAGYPIVDQLGHGTHVAGIAGALNNDIGVLGVAPDLHLTSANVDIGGQPNVAEVACSIDVARINSIRVANMSLSLPPSTAVTDAINGGYNYDNMLFVASSGNDGLTTVSYPASLANVIAVGSVAQNKSLSWFSNTGTAMELVAPGEGILSTALVAGLVCANGTQYATCTGTSMAAPHVTGAAAVVWAYYPAWTNTQVRARLASTATDLGSSGWDTSFGYGLVNVAAAVP